MTSISSYNPLRTLAQAASLSQVGSSHQLKAGSSGPEVSTLQDMLRSKGFDPGPTDGSFGPKTQAALKAFQKSTGVGVDGIVGPETKAALFGLQNTKPAPTPARPSSPHTADVFEPAKTTAVQQGGTASGADVVKNARTKLGQDADVVKRGNDPIGLAMRDDVGNRVNCANFVSGVLCASGQITAKDMSAGVDGLVGKLQKTGNFTTSKNLNDAQPGDVVAFDHAHVMICTGRDAKTGEPTFIGSNNVNKDGTQKITEGTLKSMLGKKTLEKWQNNAVVLHRN
ncbi:MAG: peptidoglycan-binding protein [Archangium sp.]